MKMTLSSLAYLLQEARSSVNFRHTKEFINTSHQDYYKNFP